MKRTSTEAHVYMRHHQGVRVKHFDASNVIYHKISHSTVSYMLNGENINIMLESAIMIFLCLSNIKRDLCLPNIRRDLDFGVVLERKTCPTDE